MDSGTIHFYKMELRKKTLLAEDAVIRAEETLDSVDFFMGKDSFEWSDFIPGSMEKIRSCSEEVLGIIKDLEGMKEDVIRFAKDDVRNVPLKNYITDLIDTELDNMFDMLRKIFYCSTAAACIEQFLIDGSDPEKARTAHYIITYEKELREITALFIFAKEIDDDWEISRTDKERQAALKKICHFEIPDRLLESHDGDLVFNGREMALRFAGVDAAYRRMAEQLLELNEKWMVLIKKYAG